MIIKSQIKFHKNEVFFGENISIFLMDINWYIIICRRYIINSCYVTCLYVKYILLFIFLLLQLLLSNKCLFSVNLIGQLVKRERKSRLERITKPRARKFRFNRAHPLYFYPLIVERITKRETPNALKYLFPLILTHRDFSFKKSHSPSHAKKIERLVSSTLYFCSRDALPLQDLASVSLLFPRLFYPFLFF